MSHNDITPNAHHDANLREALARRARKCPQMPADLNGRLMERVETLQPHRPTSSPRWMWPSVAACIVVAVIVGYTLRSAKSYMPAPFLAGDTQVLYASIGDTAYRSPALVDEFIVKLAGYYGIEQELYDNTSTADVANYLYVFPDEMKVDVFGRLLQVACCYDNTSPGYQLHLSQSQFHFELNDLREGRHHIWMAEKIGGNTFLYGVNVPEGVIVSNANYTEYRDRHIVGNNRYAYYKF